VQDYSGEVVSRKVFYLLDRDEQEPRSLPEPPQGMTESVAEEDPIRFEDDFSRQLPPESPASDETEVADPDFPGTENDAWIGEPEVSAEVPPELPVFDMPEAEPADNFPADSVGGFGGAGTETEAWPGEAEPSIGAETGFAEAGAEYAEAGDVETETAAGFPEAGAEPVETADTGTESAAEPAEAETGLGAAETGNAETETTNETVDTARVTVGTGGSSALLPAETAKPEPTPVIPEDQIVLVKQLDGRLPSFRITENIKIDRYNLVFQVLGEKGEKEILYRTFKPIYFLGDADFTLGDIRSFLPVAVTGGKLIPPGINVMLQTEISADERLDPYVIWYSGKTILARGRVTSGANYLLWKAPERTGFHSIRAEVFPLLPEHQVPGNMLGKTKELSLPVSLKSTGVQCFDESRGEFINWYQLWGNLDDAKDLNNDPKRKLVPLHPQPPRWIPYGGMYSLLVGREDIYALPGMPFKLSQDEQGTGRVALHMAALSDGAILSIRFVGGEILPQPAAEQGGARAAADDSMGTAALDLFIAGNALSLRISSEDASAEKSLELSSDESGVFVTAIVEFTITPNRLDAELFMENPDRKTDVISVDLAKPISGEGTVHLGNAEWPVSNNAKKYGNGTMALNELALLYTRVSIRNEEQFEPAVQESLMAGEEESGAEPEPSALSAL
jgi:hypothetical protein